MSTGPSGISGVNDRAVEAGLDWGVGVGEDLSVAMNLMPTFLPSGAC